MDLLIGTSNPGKLREYRALLRDLRARLLDLSDVGLANVDIEETGATFEANALLKARAYAQASGLYTLADDSGLAVDALDGQPGVYAHRYAGPNATDEDRYRKLLGELEGVPDEARTARFICVVVLVNSTSFEAVTTTGIVEGYIAHAPGENVAGFGYDPVFIPEGFDAPLSALSMDDKNQLSHRGNALRQMLPILQRLIEEQTP